MSQVVGCGGVCGWWWGGCEKFFVVGFGCGLAGFLGWWGCGVGWWWGLVGLHVGEKVCIVFRVAPALIDADLLVVYWLFVSVLAGCGCCLRTQ